MSIERATTCKDCGVTTVRWVQTDGRWKMLDVILTDAGKGRVLLEEHWKTCQAPAAWRRRKRAGMVKGIVPMSVNRIEDFRRCKELYRRKHILHEKLPASPEMMLGRAVHTFAAALALEQPDADKAWDQLPPEIAHQRPVLEKGIADLIARIDREKLLGVEERGTMRWKVGEASVEFEVVPDRAELDEDLVTVVDYKTSWAWPSKDDVQRSLQLQAYGLHFIKEFDFVQRVRGRLELVRYGGRGVVEAYWSREELLSFEQALKHEVEAIIKEEEFAPNPDCTECPAEWHLRRERAALLDAQVPFDVEGLVLPPRDAQEAYRLARGRKIIDLLGRAATAVLSEWTRHNGPIKVGDGGYGHFLEATKVYDVEAVITALKAAGVPLQAVMKYDFQSGKKYLSGKKAIPGLADLITEVYESGFRWAKDYDAEVKKLDEVVKLANDNLTEKLEGSLPFVTREELPEVIEGGTA